MLDFFRALFGTDFMPHLYCLRGEPGVLWLQVLSDAGIACAYFAIPVLLFDVVRSRKDLLFRKVAMLFVAFIAACGFTHVLAVWTIWIPMYRLEGVAKAATAGFSIATAVVLLRLRPILLRLPSIAEVEEQIDHRIRAEMAVSAAKERLANVVDSVQDYAVYSIDLEGLVVTWDIGAERMKGYTTEEILGRNFSCFYSQQDITDGKPAQAIAKAREMGRYEGQGWRYRKDGSRFWANVIMRAHHDASGALLGFTKVTHDLTESRENETKFQALLEAAPDAIFIINGQDKIDFLNSQAEKLFGYARSELLGKPVDILTPERLREEQAKYRAQIFSELKRMEANEDAGMWALHKDGHEFPIEFSLSPLETRDGWVFLIAIRSVADRKKAESRFRALLESAPDAMVIVNAEGVIELANLQTEKIFGYSRMELIGESVDMLVPQPSRATHGIYRRGYFVSPKRREMGSGLDLMALRKDGSQFPVEISLSPLEGENGTSVTAAIRDVTDRKKAENRFRALLESAPDAMVIVNSEGLIELANKQTEKLFGYSRMELVSQSVDVLVPEIREAVVSRDSPQFLLVPKRRLLLASLEVQAVRKDGTEFPVEITLSPLEGPDGASVTAAIRDVSERKVAADELAAKVKELRHSNQQLEQFAHIASHDLQEPLRMVTSYTQLLAKRYKGRLDSDADEFIAYAVDGTQRMKRLIEDLLLYSRAGKGLPPMREFSSADAVQTALNNLRASMEECHAQITCDPLPSIVAAEGSVVQIFQNLIGNAIKYRGDRIPSIHISTSVGDGEWIFSVADNGIGIEEKYFDRIFQIFQRLHGQEEYEGTGIGLAICQRILQQQGGRIWVESQPGHGSTFHFALPVS